MKKPMRKYKNESVALDKHSFVQGRKGLVYAEFGVIKTYANKTQTENKCKQLTDLGFNVSYSIDYPFVIVQI